MHLWQFQIYELPIMRILTTIDLSVILLISFFAIGAIQIARIYARLRHIPGPPLAALTDLWFFLKTWNGTTTKELTKQLHEGYGPVVRLGAAACLLCRSSRHTHHFQYNSSI